MCGRLDASSLNSTWAWLSFRLTTTGNTWPWWSGFSDPFLTGIQTFSIRYHSRTRLFWHCVFFCVTMCTWMCLGWAEKPRPSIFITAVWIGTRKARRVGTFVKIVNRSDDTKSLTKTITSSSSTWFIGCLNTNRRRGSRWRKLWNIRFSTKSRLTSASVPTGSTVNVVTRSPDDWRCLSGNYWNDPFSLSLSLSLCFLISWISRSSCSLVTHWLGKKRNKRKGGG